MPPTLATAAKIITPATHQNVLFDKQLSFKLSNVYRFSSSAVFSLGVARLLRTPGWADGLSGGLESLNRVRM